MVTRLLFGVRNSPQRKICAALAWIVALLGLGVGVMQGWAMGLPVVLVGLLAVAVLSRQTAAHHEKTETRAQLTHVTGDRDDDALRQMVERTPHDPNRQMAKVTAGIDAHEIERVVASVRS